MEGFELFYSGRGAITEPIFECSSSESIVSVYYFL